MIKLKTDTEFHDLTPPFVIPFLYGPLNTGHSKLWLLKKKPSSWKSIIYYLTEIQRTEAEAHASFGLSPVKEYKYNISVGDFNTCITLKK